MSAAHAKRMLATRIGRGGGGHHGGGGGGGGHHGGGHRGGGPGWFGPGWYGGDYYDLSAIDCAPGAHFPGWECDPSGHWHKVGFGALALPSMPSWLQTVLPLSDDSVKSPTLVPNKRWLLPAAAGAALAVLACKVL